MNLEENFPVLIFIIITGSCLIALWLGNRIG